MIHAGIFIVMRIDHKARPWIVGTFVIFVLAAGAFIYYWHQTHGRPDGGSLPGLAFGVAGLLAMLVAMLLVVRKKMRSCLLGRTYFWMQAHVWFGLISYPLIIFHAGGFGWGGTLTQILMWMFTTVYISGIIGLILQQIIPIRLTREVPAETIADQIMHVQQILREEAKSIVRSSRAGGQVDEFDFADNASGAVAISAIAVAQDQFTPFYEQRIVPFLADRFDSESPLATPLLGAEEFRRWRTRLDPRFYSATARLESIVDERRQLAHQRRLQSWLQGWLLIHVPFSYALIVLAAVHSLMAFRYNTIWR